MRELRVNPSDVLQSGVEISDIAATVKSAFTDSDTEVASAQSGWIGMSAAALGSLAAEWQEATAAHHQNLAEHGSKFVTASKKYGQIDESEADAVRNAAENI